VATRGMIYAFDRSDQKAEPVCPLCDRNGYEGWLGETFSPLDNSERMLRSVSKSVSRTVTVYGAPEARSGCDERKVTILFFPSRDRLAAMAVKRHSRATSSPSCAGRNHDPGSCLCRRRIRGRHKPNRGDELVIAFFPRPATCRFFRMSPHDSHRGAHGAKTLLCAP